MMNFTELASVSSDRPVPFTDQLRLAVAAYLARFKGSSREHTESDLRAFLTWCAARGLDPLAARRPHLELYIRWMQEIRRFKPSTVSRRFSVAAGFYKTCAIDGILENSPRRIRPAPGGTRRITHPRFTHLQFEALLTAARQSAHPCDFALVAMLGLLGLRIFEATGADIPGLGEEHGTGSCACAKKAPKSSRSHCRQPSGAPSTGRSTGRSAPALPGRFCSTAAVPGWTATPPPAASRRLAETAGIQATRAHPHMLCHIFVRTMPGAGVDLRDVQIAARHADRAPRCFLTGLTRTSTAIRTTSWLPTWPRVPERAHVSCGSSSGRRPALPMSGLDIAVV